jgi:putative salt-induced outer membrane protein
MKVTHVKTIFLSTGVVLSVSLFASAGFAEEPKTLLSGKAATSGSEDVATTGFEAKTAQPAAEASTDALELKISAGGISSGGNSESLALTSTSKLRYRRDNNQIGAALAGNYGRARPAGGTDTETTVENLQGKIRYDRFLSDRFALFAAMSGLTNRFQGLVLRLNFDPGLAYYFLNGAQHQFWGELGYDLQYDLRRDDALLTALANGVSLEKADVSHNGRAFLGYTNNLSKTFAFDTGIEYLQGFEESKNWRLNWDLGLTSSIAGNLSLATTFSLRYDHNPLPDIEKTDYTTAVSLVYQLL